MKLSTKSAAAMILLMGLATSCASDVETGINPDPQGNAINFAASVGRSARATEIDIQNLGDFAVIARGMHPNGTLYDHYLIGDSNEGEIAHFENLNEDNTGGIWKLDRSVYWPSTMDRLFFIAYTTLTRGESSKNGVLGGATFIVSNDIPTIKNFKPFKAPLTTTDDDQRIWADGEGQKDLLVAFKQQDKGIQTTVGLKFRHALTQVSITAKQNGKADTDNRIVKIKGAWIVNAAESGTLTAVIDVKNEVAPNKTYWEASNNETYGSYYTDIINLTKETDKDLLHHTLMLVPQNLTAWDKTSNDVNGAYIMLLCRVELEHEGATHSGADITDIGIIGTDENGKHYHQLFPVNPENSTYDGAQYGFVCVPFSTDWAERLEDDPEDCKGAGMHYTYNLDICGATSGAGIYPPITNENAQALIAKLIPEDAKVSALVLNGDKYNEQTVDLKVVATRPTEKKIGDPVLDEPIKFSVSVSDWADPDESWKDGNVSL